MERIYKNQLRKTERIEILKQVFINILLDKNITNKTKDKLTTEYIKKLQELKQQIIEGGKH